MEIVSADQIHAARSVLGELLALKRFCALVHPVLRDHEVTDKRGRKRMRKAPSGEFLVAIFTGGKAIVSRSYGAAVAEGINRQLVPITRTALKGQLLSLNKRAKLIHGVESLRNLDDDLVSLTSASGFGVEAVDVGNTDSEVHPTQAAMTGVRFAGDMAAKVRADEFCMLVNQVLAEAFSAKSKALSERLIEVVGEL